MKILYNKNFQVGEAILEEKLNYITKFREEVQNYTNRISLQDK